MLDPQTLRDVLKARRVPSSLPLEKNKNKTKQHQHREMIKHFSLVSGLWSGEASSVVYVSTKDALVYVDNTLFTKVF